MSFNQGKESKNKFNADRGILKTLSLINRKKDFYSTSSCLGRICILESQKKWKKGKIKFIKKWHRKVRASEVWDVLEKIRTRNDIWFRQEGLILHICCRNIECAAAMLQLARRTFKRAGIIALGRKIVIEIIGTDRIDAPLARDGKIIVDRGYVAALVSRANEKVVQNLGRIGKFDKDLKINRF